MPRTRRPAGWPPLMVEKSLATGGVAYYWAPPTRDRRAGCPVGPEALGADYTAACDRARMLGAGLAAWRQGRGATPPDLDHGRRFGTLAWLVERYMRSEAWARVSPRAQPEYRRALRLVLEIPMRSGQLGEAPLRAISARGVDMAYARLRTGPDGPRVRQAVVCIARMARAWDVVARLYPGTVAAENPWRGVDLVHGTGTTQACTRAEMMALHRALAAMGEIHLAAVPLLCWEWHLRPENVLAGHFTWRSWKPADRPGDVMVPHHKTGALGWRALTAGGVRLYPEIEDWLDRLPRAGVPVVLMTRERHGRAGGWREVSPRPYRMQHAQRLVREARAAAGLGDHVTLAACRHGGMTELGDAGLTEQEVMASSQHRTPDAARLYVKRTEAQVATAALKRRRWVDREG